MGCGNSKVSFDEVYEPTRHEAAEIGKWLLQPSGREILFHAHEGSVTAVDPSSFHIWWASFKELKNNYRVSSMLKSLRVNKGCECELVGDNMLQVSLPSVDGTSFLLDSAEMTALPVDSCVDSFVLWDPNTEKIVLTLKFLGHNMEQKAMKLVSDILLDLYEKGDNSNLSSAWTVAVQPQDKDGDEVARLQRRITSLEESLSTSSLKRYIIEQGKYDADPSHVQWRDRRGSIIVAKHTEVTALPVIRILDYFSKVKRMMLMIPELAKEMDIEESEIDYVESVLWKNKLFAPDFVSNSVKKAEDDEGGAWVIQELSPYSRDSVNELCLTVRSVGKVLHFSNILREKAKLRAEMTLTRVKDTFGRILEPCVPEFMKKVSSYSFDIFEFERETKGRPLYSMALGLVDYFGLVSRIKMNVQKLVLFFDNVEKGYNENPYHNKTHAADVLQTMMCFIINGNYLDEMTAHEILAVIISASVHDLHHPGTTNAFQIKTRSELALVYNDISVLENYHVSRAFKLMYNDANNFLEDTDTERANWIRELVVSLVLATDMGKNFDYLGKFQAQLSRQSEGTKSSFKPENREDMKLMLQLLIKCSDVSNPAKPLPLYKQWVNNVMNEFFQQGDLEKSKGMPISPYMNRETTDIAKCQLSFVNFLALPLFEMLVNFDESYVNSLNTLLENRSHWEKICEENK